MEHLKILGKGLLRFSTALLMLAAMMYMFVGPIALADYYSNLNFLYLYFINILPIVHAIGLDYTPPKKPKKFS